MAQAPSCYFFENLLDVEDYSLVLEKVLDGGHSMGRWLAVLWGAGQVQANNGAGIYVSTAAVRVTVTDSSFVSNTVCMRVAPCLERRAAATPPCLSPNLPHFVQAPPSNAKRVHAS